jgi:hypothetical protein
LKVVMNQEDHQAAGNQYNRIPATVQATSTEEFQRFRDVPTEHRIK